MGNASGERVKEVAHGEQAQTQKGACEIDIMTDAVCGSPAHRRKEVEGFANMDKHDNDETRGSEHLDERGSRLGSRVECHRAGKQDKYRHQRNQSFSQRRIHGATCGLTDEANRRRADGA